MNPNALFRVAPDGGDVSPAEVRELVAQACPAENYRGRRVLLIVPDATRTAPVGLVFKALHEQISAATAACDVMIALGTHPPMSEEAICARLEITAEERRGKYARVQLLNHEWSNPAALADIGTIPADELVQLRALNVTPEFVAGFDRLGYGRLPVSTLVQLKALGITPEFAQSVAPNSRLSVDDLVQAKLFGRRR